MDALIFFIIFQRKATYDKYTPYKNLCKPI